MADQECKEACKDAYKARVTRLFDVMAECLLTADTEAAKEECKNRFRRGLKAAREARQACLKLCEE
jgi:hypothetical protein